MKNTSWVSWRLFEIRRFFYFLWRRLTRRNCGRCKYFSMRKDPRIPMCINRDSPFPIVFKNQSCKEFERKEI